MLLSCGVILMSEEQGILLAHVTHAPQWDLPKGCADRGESAWQAAVREVREETGLELDKAPLLDLGRFDYQPRKRLHLFALKLPAAAVDPARCRCSTKFTDRTGRRWPEMDAYRWVHFGEISRHCRSRMSRVLLEEVDLVALHPQLTLYEGAVQRTAPRNSASAR